MTDNTYNGWTNYATWRVNLEMFDGRELEPSEIYGEAYQIGNELREQAEELICMDAPEGLARDYALAFLSDVNWTEIATHMIDNAKEEQDA